MKSNTLPEPSDPYVSRPRRESAPLRAFGDMSWTSVIAPELKETCAQSRRSGRAEAVSAALLVAFALLGMTVGLRSMESTAHTLRSVFTTPTAHGETPQPWMSSQSIIKTRRDSSGDSMVCPAGMALVDGEHCPEVEHQCVRWMETKGPHARSRCAEYAQPSRCVSARVPMRFCIDRNEYTPAGESLPASNQSWTDAKRACEGEGKRLCGESEWVFACEGEEMRPYPYGFTRDAGACNADRVDLFRPDGSLRDLRDDADGHPGCVSTFGVHHMAGNLEEWTTIDGSSPPRPAMKGAYWQPGRNHCRAAQTAHDQFYGGVETGFRCCADAR
jgi:Sulfatase-modifying factor enzyme 1